MKGATYYYTQNFYYSLEEKGWQTGLHRKRGDFTTCFMVGVFGKKRCLVLDWLDKNP